MKKVLIIYENIPDSTKEYLLELSQEDFEKVIKCHKQYLNLCDNPCEDECNWLSDYLTDCVPLDSSEPISISENTTVVITGFVC